LRRSLILALICIMFSSLSVASQTRRGRTSKRSGRPSTSYAEKEQAEIRAGRERIAAQIKALTQFLYLFAGVSKGIENAELANRNREVSSVSLSVEQIERNKAKVRDSIRNVRAGLEGLESSFRTNPALQSYYPNQAGSSNFDQSGRTLIMAVNKLADALVALR
jgi:hypothetical protein